MLIIQIHMKKTLSVNLGGTVYHIDEDAYTELMDYLQDVKLHLGNDASSEEVLNDIEQRINELFGQWMQGRREVITTLDVDKVIGILGRPEQYENPEKEAYKEPDFQKNKQEQNQNRSEDRSDRPHRHLYRDTDNALIGGVCSGLAVYLNVGIVLIRLILFFLIWFGGTGLLFYFICWIIIPEARTAAQRLEMRGEDVTIENIEKKVREEYGKVKDRVGGYVSSSRTQQNFQHAGRGILEFVRICIKVFFAFIAGIIGFSGFLALVALIMGLMILWTGNIHFASSWPQQLVPLQQTLMNPSSATFMTIGLVLTIGIPFIALFNLLFARALDLKPSPKWMVWVGFVFWFLGLILCVYSGINMLSCFGGVWI